MRHKSAALHVIEQGPSDAPAVILIHAIASHSGMWSAQIPIWSRSFRVLALDLPGHGRSPPDPQWTDPGHYIQLMTALLERFQLKRCSIVGLSLGGMIGQMFALAHPERVHSLVLANTSARLPPEMYQRWEARKLEALTEGMESQVAPTLGRWFTPEFSTRAPLTVQWVADMIRSTHPEGYRAAITAIQAANTFDLLPTLRCPVLVVAGRRDTATPLPALQGIAVQIPGAQLEVLESAAHLSNLAEPTEFAELAGAFLHRAYRTNNGAS